jgi:hypothetical protein
LLLGGDGQATACMYCFDLIWLEAQDVRSVELIPAGFIFDLCEPSRAGRLR